MSTPKQMTIKCPGEGAGSTGGGGGPSTQEICSAEAKKPQEGGLDMEKTKKKSSGWLERL
jgi:hypothetical protein